MLYYAWYGIIFSCLEAGIFCFLTVNAICIYFPFPPTVLLVYMTLLERNVPAVLDLNNLNRKKTLN
jgi:hypothetical protein